MPESDTLLPAGGRAEAGGESDYYLKEIVMVRENNTYVYMLIRGVQTPGSEGVASTDRTDGRWTAGTFSLLSGTS